MKRYYTIDGEPGIFNWYEVEARGAKESAVWAGADEIAAAIREQGTWDPELLEALCYEADMSDEWDAAGENFEDVAFAAAAKLGVEI